jgi:hypothetical protein
VQTSLPMMGIWRTIRDYILWSYERGTIQYDVMVTLILIFVFLSPYWIDFKDKPVQLNPHRMEVLVVPDAQGGLIFKIDGSAIQAKQDDQVRAELLRVITPISGAVDINKVEAERDKSGRVLSYKVWAHKGQ